MKTLEEAVKIINGSSYCAMSLSAAERGVSKLVKVEINPYQFSALVSFLISIGTTEFKKSQVLKLTNKKQFLLAAAHFEDDDYKGGENKLERRRKAERRLYTAPILKKNNGKTHGVPE